jgi:hypothetical protein
MTREERINHIIEGLEKLGMANLESLKALTAYVCKGDSRQSDQVPQAQTRSVD